MSLQNKKIVITAGPTYESIDPVRFIGNHSSGKMGYELANTCLKKGANVFLISGPSSLTPPKGVTFIKVQSAQDMYEAVNNEFENTDIFIFSAAVADYTPKTKSSQKIKKKTDTFSIELVKTIDIAKTIGERKKKHQLSIAFALETNNELENAKKKLTSKNVNFVVLNSLQNQGTCFGTDQNKITIVEDNKTTNFDIKPKSEVAFDIISHLEKIMQLS